MANDQDDDARGAEPWPGPKSPRWKDFSAPVGGCEIEPEPTALSSGVVLAIRRLAAGKGKPERRAAAPTGTAAASRPQAEVEPMFGICALTLLTTASGSGM